LKDALTIVITGQKRQALDVSVIYVILLLSGKKTWMAGTSPAMTERG
jgi:hypothetical protein